MKQYKVICRTHSLIVPLSQVCQTCFDGGELLLCSSCPRSYHVDCLNAKFKGLAKKPNFFCPQHECADCEKKTTDAGGLIYRQVPSMTRHLIANFVPKVPLV